ncbi:uncharacterized protein OGAPODRAFT_10419 [Ogataea polymorpha]|uniref:uncharacterized protein n=1 Tax=Ogataea polymorpha TaxID=460523 RepID=UPI0007F35544|nr:uncharacterized protein OGAPODRAFT_10419 [Ogataea polymorpha]OBA13754.1 hypothetical protein OGAPODRAFT_10419 [Ogataea polymorpha]
MRPTELGRVEELQSDSYQEDFCDCHVCALQNTFIRHIAPLFVAGLLLPPVLLAVVGARMYCWFYDEWNLGRSVRKSRPSDDGSRYEDKSVVSDPFADPTDGSGADTGIEARWDAHCRVQEGMSRWSGRALIGLFAQACLGMVVALALTHRR